MKKSFFILLIALFTLAISINVGAAYDVSKRARIGIKYGSTRVSTPTVTSTTKSFIFSHVEKDLITEFAVKNTAKLKVSSSNSYLVCVNSYLESFDKAEEYCSANPGLITYIKDKVIYVVYDEIYSENDANLKLESAKLLNETAYIISPSDSLIKVYDESAGILLFSQDENIKLGISAVSEGLMDFGNQDKYRDIIEFIRVGNSFNLISNLTMQHYLYSVVPAEIGASAPIEAQKAQAVCARTYYEENINRHKADGFSLCGTTHCQMYIGTKWEREQSNKAVDETENMIITYNGKPISAVYFAHSGGYTANVEDVWGSPYPYLKSVEDKYCTDYTWEYKIDYNELTKKMNDKGYNLGDITQVRIDEKKDSGLVTKLTIVGTKGEKTFLRESARTILNLKSQNFDIPIKDISSLVKTDKGTKTANVTKVLTANGVKDVSNSVTVKDGNKNTHTLKGEAGNIIYGKGNGHHVGFSQHGAMEYAKEGWDYIKILTHYYQGVTIEGE